MENLIRGRNRGDLGHLHERTEASRAVVIVAWQPGLKPQDLNMLSPFHGETGAMPLGADRGIS